MYMTLDIQLCTDCYTGDGSDYRGNATRTEKGTKCISWETPELNVNAESHPNQVALMIF